MIGNDIVDIVCASKESNWNRKGYLDKIFTVREQAYIFNSDRPDEIVWLLWSMKESVYKVYMQQYQKSFFAPLKFNCSVINNYLGEVSIGCEKYTTFSEIKTDLISTVAFREIENDKRSFIKENLVFSGTGYKTQQYELRLAILEKISTLVNLPKSLLKIEKDYLGIPYVFNKARQLDISISLSHHGRFGAYAIAI